MKAKPLRHTAIALSVGGLLAPVAAQERLTTAQVLANTMVGAPACAAWRPSGTCFWLRCGFWGCRVRASLRVSHYHPDVVVSSFHDLSTHPWLDWGGSVEGSLAGPTARLLGAAFDSAGTRTRTEGRDQAKLYRDADAIGHPGNLRAMLPPSAGIGLLCPSRIRAFQPYFSSLVDALAWRSIVPVEALYPASLVPGLREVGTWPANTWGNLFPRDGNVTQQHPIKGAAILSQRIGDITTRTLQPHLYVPLPTGGRQMVGGFMVWQPPALVERNGATGRWQMIAPRAEAACRVFGDNDTLLPLSYGDGRTSGSGSYAFNLWRPYSCCARAGSVFLGAVTF